MRWLLITFLFLLFQITTKAWGFYAHKRINYLAVFLLPPEMLHFYKNNVEYLSENAVNPDKRRYAIPEEGPRHYIDLDRYGSYPFQHIPTNWDSALHKINNDTLYQHGIAPWRITTMQQRLQQAFKDQNHGQILRLSADIGHYIADLHVPLHTVSNYNGQQTQQHGIHGLWESRLPELLADNNWTFFLSPARYINQFQQQMWEVAFQSFLAADTVLTFEKKLAAEFPAAQQFSFEYRNEIIVRQYSEAYAIAYDKILNGMVERRMKESIQAVADAWYTAWVNAGQPAIKGNRYILSVAEEETIQHMNREWKKGKIAGRAHE